jgi:curli biogenesis system outer membrane secretion channel CsgG
MNRTVRVLLVLVLTLFAAAPAFSGSPATIAVPGFSLWRLEQPVRILSHESDAFASVIHSRYRDVEVEIDEEFLKQIELPVLTDLFIGKLAGSSKFAVVERSRAEAFLSGVEKAAEGPSGAEEVLKRGAELGAQYLALGTLTYAAHDIEREPVAYTSRTNLLERGEIRVELKIIETSTGRIAAAVPGKARIERRIKQEAAGPGSLPGSMLADLREELAHDLMVRTVDAFYPFKVVSVNGSAVIADRGENFRIRTGEVFEVIRWGEPVKDPDTGEVIAFDEQVLCRAVVTGVFPKACRLETAGGSAKVLPGDVLRPAGAEVSR